MKTCCVMAVVSALVISSSQVVIQNWVNCRTCRRENYSSGNTTTQSITMEPLANYMSRARIKEEL